MNIIDKNKLGLVVWGTKRGKVIFFTDNFSDKHEVINKNLHDIQTPVSISSIRRMFYSFEYTEKFAVFSIYRTIYDWMGRNAYYAVSIYASYGDVSISLAKIHEILKKLSDLYWDKYIATSKKRFQISRNITENKEKFVELLNEFTQNNYGKSINASNLSKTQNRYIKYEDDNQLSNIFEHVQRKELKEIKRLIFLSSSSYGFGLSCAYPEMPKLKSIESDDTEMPKLKLIESDDTEVSVILETVQNKNYSAQNVKLKITRKGKTYNINTDEKGKYFFDEKFKIAENIIINVFDEKFIHKEYEKNIRDFYEPNTDKVVIKIELERKKGSIPENTTKPQTEEKEKEIEIIITDKETGKILKDLDVKFFDENTNKTETKKTDKKGIITIKVKNKKFIDIEIENKYYHLHKKFNLANNNILEIKVPKKKKPKNILNTKKDKFDFKKLKKILLFIVLPVLLIAVSIFGVINFLNPKYDKTKLRERVKNSANVILKKDWKLNEKDYKTAKDSMKNILMEIDTLNTKKYINKTFADSCKNVIDNRETEIDSIYKTKLQLEIKKHIAGINFDLDNTEKLINASNSSGIKNIDTLSSFKEICENIKFADNRFRETEVKKNDKETKKVIYSLAKMKKKFKFLNEKQKKEIKNYLYLLGKVNKYGNVKNYLKEVQNSFKLTNDYGKFMKEFMKRKGF